MLHSTGTWGYYLRNNDLLLYLSDLNNELLIHSTEHLDVLLKIITCSKQWKGALNVENASSRRVVVAWPSTVLGSQNVVRIKKVAHKAIAKYVTDVLATFWHLPWHYWTQQHRMYLLYIIKWQMINFACFNQKSSQGYPFPTLTNFGNSHLM